MAPIMSTARRTTASLREAKKRKTGLRCQAGRVVVKVAIVVSGHFPREVRLVQRESSLNGGLSLDCDALPHPTQRAEGLSGSRHRGRCITQFRTWCDRFATAAEIELVE